MIENKTYMYSLTRKATWMPLKESCTWAFVGNKVRFLWNQCKYDQFEEKDKNSDSYDTIDLINVDLEDACPADVPDK